MNARLIREHTEEAISGLVIAAVVVLALLWIACLAFTLYVLVVA